MAKVRAIAGVPATAKKSAEIKLEARPKVKMSVVQYDFSRLTLTKPL